MKTVEIKENSINKIINVLLPYTNAFSFIIRGGLGGCEIINTLLNELSNHLINKQTVNEWPGTKLLLDDANLFKYQLNEETIRILGKQSDNIFEWVLPNLPEDLILYKNKNPVFISITHEKDLYLELDDNFDIQKVETLL